MMFLETCVAYSLLVVMSWEVDLKLFKIDFISI